MRRFKARSNQTFNPKLYRHAVLTDNGAFAMIWAALNNQESTMQKLLEQGADPTTNDIDSEAQPDESLENVIKQAIDDGTSLELGIEGGNSRTPLAYAAQLGHSGIVKLLIDAGVDVDARGRDGTTPMTWAVSQGHDNVLALLLAKDASIDVVVGCCPNPLAWAITHGYTKIVQLLIAKDKAQVNCRTPIRLGLSKLEGSPLSTAVRYGYEEIVCLLLSAGAVVAPTDFDHASPLHWAVWNDQERMIGLLVDHGADVEATDARNKTPLQWAARDGRIRALEVLLDRGAKVDGRGRRRTTALTIAAARDNGIARLLLKRNANIDARDRYDRTPLHIAAQYGVANNVRDLLDNGADPTVTTKHGYTPVSLAVQHSNTASVLALLGGGTPLEWAPQLESPLTSYGIDIPDLLNRTPLFYATIYNEESMVRLLLNRGSTATHVQTRACRSPLRFAMQHKLQSILRLLIDPSKATVDMESLEGFRQGKGDVTLYLFCHRCSVRISGYDDYLRCNSCGNGGFKICVECIANGMSCDDASHNLERGLPEW